MNRDESVIKEMYERYARYNQPLGQAQAKLHVARKQLIWNLVIGSTHAVKRALDISAAGTGMVILSPVFSLTALAIKLESPGPLFFAQERIGRHGRSFKMYKFRSMVVDAEQKKESLLDKNESGGGVTFKMKNDPRITRVGRFIRKFSIDELPQLFNILRGDMSLVGPRPPVPKEVDQYKLHERKRLEVTPGLTCIWQVNGRSDIDFHGQVRLDVQYIESRSFRTDATLLLKTIPVVLLGQGAY